MEPVALLTISYQSVNVLRVLMEIHKQLSGGAPLQQSLENISSALRNIEALLAIQVYQPLKSGLAMLSDAEAEYQIDKESAQGLANTALQHFNRAEGQLTDTQNQIIAITGKACAYKLLGKLGAYNNAASQVNALCNVLQQKRITDEARKVIGSVRLRIYLPATPPDDFSVDIIFDGTRIGTTTVKQGFDKIINTNCGTHEVSVKRAMWFPRNYQFHFEPGSYCLTIPYAIFVGYTTAQFEKQEN